MDIVYPSTIKTDRDKLLASYPLEEQARLEYNRMGDLVRPYWGRYKDKWPVYKQLYHDKMKWFWNEQNQLRYKIRLAAYPTREAWDRVTEDPLELESVEEALYGNPDELKQLTTKATSSVLTELKAVRLDSLLSTLLADPTEVLNASPYVEVDVVANRISMTADRVTWASIINTDEVYLYKDAGVNHFAGDFTHICEAQCDSQSASGGVQFFHAMSNNLGTFKTIDYASGDLIGVSFARGSTTYRVRTTDLDAGSYLQGSYVTISLSTPYWMTIVRDEDVAEFGTIYCYVFDAATKINPDDLVGTSSQALATSKKDFRYFYAMQNWGQSGAMTADGWMQYMDLQEAVGPTEQSVGEGAMSIAGSLIKMTAKTMGGGTMAIAGALSAIRTAFATVGAGTMAIAGALTKIKIQLKAVGGGTMAIAGAVSTLRKAFATVGAGSVTIVGSLVKMTTKTMGGATVAIAGAVSTLRTAFATVGAGSIAIAGSLSGIRTAIVAVGSGSVAIAGSIVKKTSKTVGGGTVTIFGVLAGISEAIISLFLKKRSISLTLQNRTITLGLGHRTFSLTLQKRE